jgi:hypothetical protein
MESSKEASNGHVLASRDAEDGQAETYNKRKALRHLNHRLPKGQVSHGGLNIHGNVPSSDFPQKKQRLVSPQRNHGIDEAFLEEFVS